MSARAVPVEVGTPSGPCTAKGCLGWHCQHIPMIWERVGWAAVCRHQDCLDGDTVDTRQEAREQAWAHNAQVHGLAHTGGRLRS